MEELRSTDALDTEIRNDARKKAEKILAKAEKSAKAILDGVDKRISDAKDSALQVSLQKIAVYEKNVNASLPLEKERYLVLYIHNAVIEAMNEYFDGLDAQKRLEVIQRLVERAKDSLSGKKVHAQVIGMDADAAKKMLTSVLGNNSLLTCTEGDVMLLAEEAVAGFKRREGIILKTEDGLVTCRLTLDEKIREILDSHSYELATSLFDGRLPE